MINFSFFAWFQYQVDLEDGKYMFAQDLTDVGASFAGNFSASGFVLVNKPKNVALKL